MRNEDNVCCLNNCLHVCHIHVYAHPISHIGAGIGTQELMMSRALYESVNFLPYYIIDISMQ